MFAPIGFLGNPHAVADVAKRYFLFDIPKITYVEMKILSEDKDTLILDVRGAVDFKNGTIATARNMPIYSSLTERQALLSDIRKLHRIIVFCERPECIFSSEIAQFLKFNGFTNVFSYPGGYREWSSRSISSAAQPQTQP